MRTRLAFLLTGAALLAQSATARAVTWPHVFEGGQKIFRAGPLPEPFDKEEELQGYEAGYACDVKGLLGSYYAVANCRPVAYQGDSYIDEPQLVGAIQARYPESARTRSFWARYGWVLLLLSVVGGIALTIHELRGGGRRARGRDDRRGRR
jgi:hypothetical protein